MGIAETKIYPINTGWLEADLGTYIFWKGPAGKKYWNPVYCHYVDTGEHKTLNAYPNSRCRPMIAPTSAASPIRAT